MKKITFLLIAIFCSISSYLFSQKVMEVFPRTGDVLGGISVTISGLNTHFASGTGTSLLFKQGSNTITGITTAYNNNFIAFHSTSNITSLGFYDLFAQNSSDGIMQKQNAVFIKSYGNAKITSVAPKAANSNSNLNVSISGLSTHFASGTGTSAVFVQGTKTIQATAYSNVQNAAMDASVYIPSNARGYYDLVTHNIVDGYNFFDYALRIKNSNLPQILSVTPDSIVSSIYTWEVNVVGQNTHFAAGNNLVYLNSYFWNSFLDSVKVLSNTAMIVYIRIPIIVKGLTDPEAIISVCNSLDGLMQFPMKIQIIGSVQESASSFNNIKVYPNPFTDIFRISSEDFSSEKEINLWIYSPLGLKIKELKIQNQSDFTIDLSQYTSGMYFLHFFNEEKSGFVKVLKN